jgi:hypothetical protein
MEDAISLDIETLSLKTNARVLQVGFCLINLTTGAKSWQTSLSLGMDQQEIRDVDPGTVAWWNDQDHFVMMSVLYPAGVVTVKAIHAALSTICQPGRAIWANSPSFDCVILRSLFEDCSLEAPWSFRDERCLRTMSKYLDPNGKLKPPVNLRAHDALSDAEWQADYLYNLTKATK